MKKVYGLLSTILAVFALITFTQCTNSGQTGNAAAQVKSGDSLSQAQGVNGLKVAYVDLDTLLSKYTFWTEVNKEMLRKEENIRVTLNEKAKDLQTDYDDFQNKLQNNIYATRQRAEEEQARILKKKDDLDKLQERLSNELMAESQKNNMIIRDSINKFLKDYNKEMGYNLIISRVGDNLLIADESMNITADVLDGLNKRYASKKEK